MKKFLLASVLFPAIVFAQGKPFELKGTVKHLEFQADRVFLQYRTGGEWKTDSADVKNGSYSFKGMLDEPSLAALRVHYANGDSGEAIAMVPRRDRATLFLQNGKIKVTSVDSFSNVSTRGSLANTEYVALNKQTKPYEEKMGPLYALYTEFSKSKNTAARDRVEAMIDSLDKQMNENVYGEYVKANPSSPIAMYALQQAVGWDIDPDQAEPLFNALSDANKNLPSAVEFRENLDIAKKTGIGRVAMDFTQEDTAGRAVTLSSFRGRYVLVDFWASWCGPCRNENPNVVKVFNKYKDRGFHIIGVSLDRPGQKEKWLKAIHDDGLAWTQVSDLQFWNNAVAKQYGIRAIPQNLLLDPEGKIIAKNVRGEELDQKVGEALQQKGF